MQVNGVEQYPGNIINYKSDQTHTSSEKQSMKEEEGKKGKHSNNIELSISNKSLYSDRVNKSDSFFEFNNIDAAKELAETVRDKIVKQKETANIAQANIDSQNILYLLM